jgi:endonuclease III
MDIDEKVTFIREILDRLFPDPKIPLQHDDPYTLLIAVLLSAQSTDLRVNQCTPALFAKAKTPQDMVQLTPEEIEEFIRPVGLSKRKSRAIWELSKLLIQHHDGKVPKNLTSLEELPGVGHKTASVMMVQAFHHPAFPVDTHIHRCAERWGLSSGKTVEQTEYDLKKLFPRNQWGKIHLQIIYFARAFCKARGHHPNQCPICSIVAAPSK